MKVCKFGGSSLADAAQFAKVKAIVEADEQRHYVVVSAPGKRHDGDQKVTDMLYAVHAQTKRGEDTAALWEAIGSRFIAIRDGLGLKSDIESLIDAIREQTNKGASEDYVVSRGEFLNGVLMADYLGYDFIDPVEAVFFTADGLYESEKTRTVMRGRLAHSARAVVPGFYGSLPDGSVKTFSRGGSDITGAIVARSARAEVYENWTDVPGFLMADPRIVKDPKAISVITYQELRELSYMGATVLHEDAVFPVFKANIPIHIKNTNNPQEKGTMIVPNLSEVESDVITGIAGRKGFTVVAMEKAKMNAELGFGRRVLYALEKNGVRFEHMPSGIDTLSVVIADAEINGKQPQLLDDVYNLCQPDSLEVFRGMALIATVGRGMIKRVGVAARIFAALARAKVNIRMIDQGSSEINIIVGVDEKDFEKAIRAIYEEFCGSEQAL